MAVTITCYAAAAAAATSLPPPDRKIARSTLLEVSSNPRSKIRGSEHAVVEHAVVLALVALVSARTLDNLSGSW